MSDETEFLRSENERLRAHVAYLEHEALLGREPWRRALHASDAQLSRLLAIVTAAQPKIGGPGHPNLSLVDAEWFDKFQISFAWLSTVGRTDAPNERRYIGHWIDEIATWGRANGCNGADDVKPDHVMAGAIAWGDISYRLGNPNLGIVASLGLAEHGGGRGAIPSWKAILAGSAMLRPPSPPQPSKMAPQPSPITIHGGDRRVGQGQTISSW